MSAWLTQLASRLAAAGNGRAPRLIIAGVGNDLRGDDRAGPAVVRGLSEHFGPALPPACLLLEAQNAPESHTGPMRRFAPDMVLFVDVAWLPLEPGGIQLVPWQDTTGMSASTHTFPLHMLATYLNHELGCDVMLLGIRPRDMALDERLSPPVQTAVAELVAGLAEIVAGLDSRDEF
jgi:hydrogenase maturation protease